MNLIEEAKALGFSDAAVISTDQLVFVPEYRVSLRGQSFAGIMIKTRHVTQSSTVEEMKEHAR